MIRVRKDFGLDTDAAPDVVFVEFAVNDVWGAEMTISQNMESIVCQLMSFKKIPVIIFVYTTSVSSINKKGTGEFTVEKSIKAHHAVAERYGIYEVNLNDYIWEGVKKGEYVWEANTAGSLTGDGVHPNDNGYDVYTKRII